MTLCVSYNCHPEFISGSTNSSLGGKKVPSASSIGMDGKVSTIIEEKKMELSEYISTTNLNDRLDYECPFCQGTGYDYDFNDNQEYDIVKCDQCEDGYLEHPLYSRQGGETLEDTAFNMVALARWYGSPVELFWVNGLVSPDASVEDTINQFKEAEVPPLG